VQQSASGKIRCRRLPCYPDLQLSGSGAADGGRLLVVSIRPLADNANAIALKSFLPQRTPLS
jgi:hypothetical protein